MKEIKQEGLTYKGTRILLGNEKRNLLNKYIEYLTLQDFEEIQLPIINFQETFKSKVGEENNNLMYNFVDRGDRELCLAPEYTAIVQKLTDGIFKYQKDVKLFYVQECFRGENVQFGRYRQFTQFGVEILNPTKDYSQYLKDASVVLLSNLSNYNNYEILESPKRGLDYYEGFTFEVEDKEKKISVCGGGSYKNGIGFAIGIDRLLNFIK